MDKSIASNNKLYSEKRYLLLLVTCFTFSLNVISQNIQKDTATNTNIIEYKLITGFKLTKSDQTPNIYTHSIIGLDIKPKNINFGFAYRNFFNAQFIGSRDKHYYANKSIRFMTATNSFDIYYVLNYKKYENFSKFGLGVYFEREQNWYDQYVIYTNSHSQGIEISYYTKLKWIHVGLRQKIQISTENRLASFDVLEKYYTQLCFEIPIKLK